MRPRRSLAGVLFILPILVVLLTTSSSTAPSAPEAGQDAETKAKDGSAKDGSAKEGFTLAVVRRDSIAIPFATYDGKRWKNSWPAPEARITAPILLADVPKRWWTGRDPIQKWTLWPLDPPEDSAASGASVVTTAPAGPSRQIETIAPTWFPAHCYQSLGLRTTYSTREVLPPPHIQPYPKAGLAVAGNATITPIEFVDIATSPLVDALARTLVKSVFDDETRIIRNYIRAGEGWSHPYTDDERKETPFRIEAMYKVAGGLGDRDVYWFEGLKHYAVRAPASSSKSSSTTTKPRQPAEARSAAENAARTVTAQAPPSSLAEQRTPSTSTPQNLQSVASAPSPPSLQSAPPAGAKGGGAGQEPCDLVTFVSGWLIGREDELLKDKERIKPMQVNVSVTSCDFASTSIMLPLGVVRVKDKALWAVQWSGWTHEHYSVIEIKDDDLSMAVLATDGGRCPRRSAR